MKINPFAAQSEKERFNIELQSQKDAQKLDLAGHSTGVDENWALEAQRERAELTRWQQDLNEDIQLMVHRLKNEVFDEEKQKWMSIGEQMCSDECIWRLVAMLEPSTSKNLMMSKYDKETILSTLTRLANSVTLLLIANRKHFSIMMSDLSPIMEIFITSAQPTYFRALGANEKEYLRSIRKDTFLHTKGEEEKKKGLFA